MSDSKILRCDPKHDYKPHTSREYIEYLKQYSSLKRTKEVVLDRYKVVRQHDRCVGNHTWSSGCRRCNDSDMLERVIALIEILLGDDKSKSI